MLLLTQDMHESYTKMRVIDLCWLYSYHMHNTQRTYLNDCWHIRCSSWICIIEAPLKFIFFHQWLKKWSNHLMICGLWVLFFEVMRVCMSVGICVCMCVCLCVCVRSISTSYSTRWWFFAYIIGTIDTVSYFHLIMSRGHKNRRVSWMDDHALCLQSCAHNCMNAACLMMKVVPFSDRSRACESCRLILSYIDESHVMLPCHLFLLSCPVFLVHSFQNFPLVLFNPFYTDSLALHAVIDLDWYFKWIPLRNLK